MRQLAALLIIFILVAGCPQEEQRYEYSVDSLSIEGREHVFSHEYNIFVKVSENSFGQGNLLAIYQDGTKIGEQFLEEPLEEFIFPWSAVSIGEYQLKAVIESSNGTAVSDSKILGFTVHPLGFYEFENDEASHPVETGVWCAQEFTLDHSVTISEVDLHLRSPVPTAEGKTVSLELVRPDNGTPGNASLGSVSIPSTGMPSNSEWHLFVFNKELSAGNYWLVLKRDDTAGIIAWTYANGNEANGAYCRDLTVSEEWFPIEGSFAFRIQ